MNVSKEGSLEDSQAKVGKTKEENTKDLKSTGEPKKGELENTEEEKTEIALKEDKKNFTDKNTADLKIRQINDSTEGKVLDTNDLGTEDPENTSNKEAKNENRVNFKGLSYNKEGEIENNQEEKSNIPLKEDKKNITDKNIADSKIGNIYDTTEGKALDTSARDTEDPEKTCNKDAKNENRENFRSLNDNKEGKIENTEEERKDILLKGDKKNITDKNIADFKIGTINDTTEGKVLDTSARGTEDPEKTCNKDAKNENRENFKSLNDNKEVKIENTEEEKNDIPVKGDEKNITDKNTADSKIGNIYDTTEGKVLDTSARGTEDPEKTCNKDAKNENRENFKSLNDNKEVKIENTEEEKKDIPVKGDEKNITDKNIADSKIGNIYDTTEGKALDTSSRGTEDPEKTSNKDAKNENRENFKSLNDNKEVKIENTEEEKNDIPVKGDEKNITDKNIADSKIGNIYDTTEGKVLDTSARGTEDPEKTCNKDAKNENRENFKSLNDNKEVKIENTEEEKKDIPVKGDEKNITDKNIADSKIGNIYDTTEGKALDTSSRGTEDPEKTSNKDAKNENRVNFEILNDIKEGKIENTEVEKKDIPLKEDKKNFTDKNIADLKIEIINDSTERKVLDTTARGTEDPEKQSNNDAKNENRVNFEILNDIKEGKIENTEVEKKDIPLKEDKKNFTDKNIADLKIEIINDSTEGKVLDISARGTEDPEKTSNRVATTAKAENSKSLIDYKNGKIENIEEEKKDIPVKDVKAEIMDDSEKRNMKSPKEERADYLKPEIMNYPTGGKLETAGGSMEDSKKMQQNMLSEIPREDIRPFLPIACSPSLEADEAKKSNQMMQQNVKRKIPDDKIPDLDSKRMKSKSLEEMVAEKIRVTTTEIPNQDKWESFPSFGWLKSQEANETKKSTQGMPQNLKCTIPEREKPFWKPAYKKARFGFLKGKKSTETGYLHGSSQAFVRDNQQESNGKDTARCTNKPKDDDSRYVFPSSEIVSDELALALFNNWSKKEEL